MINAWKTSVMKIDQRENLIRRYLLGELAEADQAALEQELLIDRGKFEQVWAVENELIDSYVRGKMSRADRKRFEGHYLASPLHRERVAIAESFLTDIDQVAGETVEERAKKPVVPWRRRFPLRSPRPVFGMTLVMALLLTFSLVWLHFERVRLTGQIATVQKEAEAERAFLKQRKQELALRNQEIEKEITDVSRRNEQLKEEIEQLSRRPDAAPAVLSILLAPAPVRGERAPPQSTIPLSAGKARLLVELNDNDYANYQAVLQTVEGREIFRRRTGKVRLDKDRAFATLPVNAGDLPKGDYILILFGQTADGKSEEIDRYFFRVS
jgi:anti-sigma factor RsiW